jgi:hypothetical protein
MYSQHILERSFQDDTYVAGEISLSSRNTCILNGELIVGGATQEIMILHWIRKILQKCLPWPVQPSDNSYL